MEKLSRFTSAYINVLSDIWQDIVRLDKKWGGYGAAYLNILKDIYVELTEASDKDKLPNFLLPTIAIVIVLGSLWFYILLIYLT